MRCASSTGFACSAPAQRVAEPEGSSSARGRPGRCGDPACAAWLGDSPTSATDIDDEEFAWATFAERELGELVACNGGLRSAIPAGAPLASIHAAIEAAGSMSELGRMVGYSVSDVSLWSSGRRRPALDAILRLCRVSGFRLVPFVSGDEGKLQSASDPPSKSVARRAAHRWIDWPKVAVMMRAAALLDAPPSVAEFAAGLGLDRNQIRSRIPEAFFELRDGYARATDLRVTLEAARREQVLDDVIRALVSEGTYPSRYRVAIRAGKELPVTFAGPLWVQWRATLDALGIPRRERPFGPRT